MAIDYWQQSCNLSTLSSRALLHAYSVLHNDLVSYQQFTFDWLTKGLGKRNKNKNKVIHQNDELSSSLSWLDSLPTDSKVFILFAEINQIVLKISFIPIPLTFMHLVALYKKLSGCKQSQVNSNSRHHCDRQLQHEILT